MNRLTKKLLSGLISVSMLLTAVPAVVSADELPSDGLLFNATFDETGTGSGSFTATAGGTVTEHGTVAYTDSWDGNSKALNISSKDAGNYLELADGLLQGKQAATFAFWLKADSPSVPNWPFMNTCETSHEQNKEKYIGMLATSENITVERYNNTDSRLSSVTAPSTADWQYVVAVYESSGTKLYSNGKLIASDSVTVDVPALFTATSKTWIGHANWGVGEGFQGSIDDFRIYGRALTADEIAALSADGAKYASSQLIAEDNCYIADTHFYIGDTEIFSLAPEYLSDVYISDLSTDTMSFKLYNAKSAGMEDLRAYAAEYTTDGRLVKVEVKDKFPEVTSDAATDITVPFTKTNAADSVKLLVWKDMAPVSQSAPESTTLTAVADVKNHTTKDGTVSVGMYYVDAEGNEYPLGDAVDKEIKSVNEEQITLTYTGTIPASAEKVIVKTTVPEGGATKDYTAATLYCGVKSPVTTPADSGTTTDGAHDPSIVKFPNDDTYYVYTSHHLIFTSEDLINWKKYDFAGTHTTNTKYTADNGDMPNAGKIQMLDKTFKYMVDNGYGETKINGTYWAPDVIYRPDDTAHPYWMYISMSRELGGMNSVIGLIKSSSPLFWADPDADIVDDGVVFATKDGQSKTNAIDVNIYTDSKDGQKYYIWGSFWGGIQAAKLKDDGFVEGVTYQDGNATLASSKNFGTSIFTQPGNGTAGPEGAWMFEHGAYRYAFTSYGWLGSNYNTRIARSPLSTSFGTNMGTQLVDANGTVMGTAISTGNLKSVPTGYKLIGSYRLGDGSRTIVNDTHNYYVQNNSGDAITYYGPGHNSAISRGDESFYVSHTRVNHAEGAATLQVRKMLFTSDGWPVVAPVTYCGEVEQKLPKDMIVGTYDLASVGQTKRGEGDIGAAAGGIVDPNRNYDLPVLSSKVTLGADMKMTNADGAEIGTWTFDDDHTVTLKFTKNGDTSGNKDEFYKSGDTMTMYAMLEYDRDAAKPVIGLTGTDQNHITQLATKSAVNVLRTEPETITEPAAKSITKSAGGNPELGFDTNGNTVYAGDPAATVIGDTVYLFVGHDTTTDSVTNANAGYTMPNWLLYTSKDMETWEYKGSVLECSSISWASNKNAAWASQMVPYNGKYYLYFCTWDSTSGGKQSIGVAVADNPEGPYTDIGHPLVKGTFTTPESSGWNDIDPTVLIDKDASGNEHRYLAWGNGKYYICELNEDMVSVKDIDGDGDIVMHKDVKEKKIKSMGGGVFTEAPWLYKRGDKYYLFYAMNWREEMAYAMTDDPFNGRYDFKQIIMPPTATSNTNHPSVIDFNNKTYFIYHNGALPNGFGFRRSVCIDELKFDENGYVYPVTETSIGLTGTASTIKSKSGKYVGHSAFENSLADASYPMHTNVTVSDAENAYATAWEIMPAKAKKGDADYDNYVSIQSVDKPGLYISSTGTGVELTQDIDNNMNDKMTFKTVGALNGDADGVSFVSVSDPNKYLTVLGDTLTLSFGQDADAATFTIGAATTKPNPEIRVATPETDPLPADDITQNFDAATGTLVSLQTTNTPAYTALEGVTLYIGTRSSGKDDATNISIGTGGRSGNALVLNAGNYQNASRGGRVQITTPVIPDGDTVTARIWVKQGKAGSVLRYNDSTSAEAGTELTGLTTEYQELVITIKNDGDVCTRTMTLGGNEIFTDYVDTFPVFWGTTENKTGQSIYFDDLTIKTTDAEGNTPTLPEVTLPDPAASFSFDGDLTDSVSSQSGTLTGSKITETTTVTAATYVDGASGETDDKAISFTGEGSYGVALPTVVKPSGANYTVSFDANINAVTDSTSMIFWADYDGDTIKGGDTDARWISIAPKGHWLQLDDAPLVWSRDVTDANTDASKFYALFGENNNKIPLNTWHTITVTASGTSGKVYVDGALVASGNIANIIDDTTKMFVGANAWDTPFNGAIDNLKLFNETLTDEQVKLLCE